MSVANTTNDRANERVIAGRYQLGKRLGIGATSTVFEASDLLLERKVAVKVLAPEVLHAANGLERFRAHARSLAELNHPNVVSVYDWGTESVRGVMVPFLVTEHVEGGTLREMIDRGRRLTPSQALVIGLDACRGLDHLHRRGLIHGQINPGNLFFGSDRRVKLSDAGIGGLLDELLQTDATSMDLSVARYASPEQATSEPLTPRTDVYSLTLCLIESVTGDVPFAAETAVASLSARVDKLLPVSADLGALAAVFEKGGRPTPKERASAAEFGRALVQAAEKLPRPTPLPLVGTAGSLFDSPEGAETTSELTRFKDPTGALRRDATGALTHPPAVVTRDASGAITRPSARSTQEVAIIDGSGAVERDSTGGIRRPGDTATDTPRPKVIAIGTDGSSAGSAVQRDSRGYATNASPRRVSPLIAVALAGALLAAVLGVIAWQKLATPSYKVPFLVGQTSGEANNAIAKNGWTIETKQENSDELPTPGLVFKTDPPAGETLRKGATFVMYISTGPTLPILPDIAGQTAIDAVNTLTGLDYVIRQNTTYHETVALGIVISATLPDVPGATPGSQVAAGAIVELLISQGPKPRNVPDPSGLTGAEYSAKLTELGLVPAPLADEFSESVAAGIVARTDPSAGSEITRGQSVQFVVSKGRDLITVPDLTGSLSDVDAALKAAGFKVAAITPQPTWVVVGVTLNGKQIKTGEQYSRNSEVVIVLLPPPGPSTSVVTSVPGSVPATVAESSASTVAPSTVSP